jgi:hypothetical protein
MDRLMDRLTDRADGPADGLTGQSAETVVTVRLGAWAAYN